MTSRIIPHFPAPYERELFYHTVARAMAETHGRSLTEKKRLFFDAEKNASFYLPPMIKCLSERLGNILSPLEVIQNHSIYPYFNFFLLESKQERFRKRVLEGENKSTYVLAYENPLDLKTMRYCPVCLLKNQKAGLPLYPRVEWQLPGIDICPFDHAYLKEYPLLEKENFKKDYLLMQEQRLSFEAEYCSDQELINISRIALDLFVYPPFCFNREDIKKRIYVLLLENGYLAPRRLKLQQLKEDLSAYYSSEILQKMKVPRTQEESLFDYWIKRAFFMNETTSAIPFYWLLVINFFCSDLEEFLSIKVTEDNFFPRSSGRKEKCPNPFCYYFKQSFCQVVSETKTLPKDEAVHIYRCPVCGTIFSKKNGEEIRILQKGKDWINGYNCLYYQAFGLDKLASSLEITKAEIHKFLETEFFTELEERVDQYRPIITNWLNQTVSDSTDFKRLVDKMKQLFPKEYAFLRKYDSIYLDKILLKAMKTD